jgi:drug/metabolite transporter (DMT)-like permease
MATRADYLKLHFLVFLWGFSAILGKLITIPAVELVFYRALLAAFGLWIVILTAKGTFRVDQRDFVRLILIGFIVALHWVAFFGAARVANVSVSLVGFATNSLWAAFLEPWYNRSRVKKFEILLGAVVILGLYIIFSFDFRYKLGLALGIAAGFTAALFSVFNSRLVRRIPAFTITFYEMIGAVTGLAIFFIFYGSTPIGQGHALYLVPSTLDWLYIGILAGVCSVYAYSAAVELMKKVSVFLIQLSLNLEPVYGIIMAVIIFGDQEKMTLSFYIGTCVILAAVLSYPFLRKRYDHSATFPG